MGASVKSAWNKPVFILSSLMESGERDSRLSFCYSLSSTTLGKLIRTLAVALKGNRKKRLGSTALYPNPPHRVAIMGKIGGGNIRYVCHHEW